MDKQPRKNSQYKYETDGEMEIQQQIMQSYQSGVIEQTDSAERQNQNEQNENQLR